MDYLSFITGEFDRQKEEKNEDSNEI